MRREKRPEIDEGLRNVVLSRLFGENYLNDPSEKRKYLGYIDGIVCEVMFFDNFIVVWQVKKELSATKFGNKTMNMLFATRGLRCYTEERVNFDNTTCVSVMYDNENVIFHFWYRRKENAV